MTELHDAVFDIKKLAILLKEGADVDDPRPEDDITPIFFAVDNNLPDSVALLIENDADPSIPDNRDLTPLQLAAREGYLECAKRLVNGGADPHGVVNVDDPTPIDIAREHGHHDIVDLLSDSEEDEPLDEASAFDDDLDEL